MGKILMGREVELGTTSEKLFWGEQNGERLPSINGQRPS